MRHCSMCGVERIRSRAALLELAPALIVPGHGAPFAPEALDAR
ncbi:MAG: hypothetical protein ACTHON_18400 [Humibacter sp.]